MLIENHQPVVAAQTEPSEEQIQRHEFPASRRPEVRAFPFPKSMLWRAIRDRCLECVGSSEAVRSCGGEEILLRDGPGRCNLYPYRFGASSPKHAGDFGFTKQDYSKKKLHQAIRGECSYCLNGNALHVCSSPNCALYEVRNKRSPISYSKPRTDAEEARLKALREKRRRQTIQSQA